MSSDGMERITVSMPPELAEAIEAELTYGDSRAEWIRGACQQRIDHRNSETPDSTGDE